jgi:RNA polymerase sigma-70 factor (ECF subfamily)
MMPSARRPPDGGLVGDIRGRGVDEESSEWLCRLRATGSTHDAAIAELHGLLVRVARREVNRRADRLRIVGPEIDDIAHQAAADALIALIGKLNEFRGDSRFTTWAYKFVVFEVSAKVGRHFWRDPVARLDAEDWHRLPDRLGFDPARESEWRDLLREIRRLVDTELSARQRHVFVALVLNAVPLDAIVEQLHSSRNAVYKTLFDARRKLRAALVANGYLDDKTADQP